MQDDFMVGERIRSIREGLNMNREKFSEMIDISNVFLGQLERGERSLSVKTLTKIVNFTGVSADYILFGNNTNNETINKINQVLRNCSPEGLNFIYEFTCSVNTFLNKEHRKL